MKIIMARVDQKLIHGQISMAWIPFLNADTLIVADKIVSSDIFAQQAMMFGLPPEIKDTIFIEPENLAITLKNKSFNGKRAIVLFKDIKAAKIAILHEFKINSLNLGNQCYSPMVKSQQIAESFFINQQDSQDLEELLKIGLNLVVQTLPDNKPIKWLNHS